MTAGAAGLEGVLLADKPAGPTSHDVVAAVRRALGTSRVGHAGTLDPFATGLLPLLVGRATRLAEYVSGLEKVYSATLRLGATSSTGDSHGELSERECAAGLPAEAAVREVLRSFVGEHDQVPHSFSAKRVGGERAYRLARRSAAFTLAPRRVRIASIDLLEYAPPVLRIRIATGPGVYVRALARDVGETLECGAYVLTLRREAVGPFHVDAAIDPTRAERGQLVTALLPPERAVEHLPVLHLEAVEALALTRGQPVTVPEPFGEPGTKVRLVGPAGFLGVGNRSRNSVRAAKILYPEAAAA